MTTTERSMSAIEAIELSQRENRIVHLAPSDVVSADLLVECDDHVEGNDEHEYWGGDADDEYGGEWRVHVRVVDVTGMVLVETMPAWKRGSHEAAGNRGSYPHNGAERILMLRELAESLVEDDSDWSHIIRDARQGDARRYDIRAEFV